MHHISRRNTRENQRARYTLYFHASERKRRISFRGFLRLDLSDASCVVHRRVYGACNRRGIKVCLLCQHMYGWYYIEANRNKAAIGRGSYMELQNFKLEINEKGVAVFTSNRPEKMNALNDVSWKEITEFFTWANTADEVKVVIVTGAGDKAFIAGADLGSLKTKTSIQALGGGGQRALDAIAHCYKPVIAAVNGYAFGGGCELSLACDFRVCSENAMFALPEVGLGLLPGAGGTQRLSRLIGMGRAKDVILLGRKIGGPEAAQIGLATKCVPQAELMAEAEKMAEKLMAKGPVAVRVAKRVVEASMSTGEDVGQLLEMLALSSLFSTEDKLEGVTAFLEKRSPEYKGK